MNKARTRPVMWDAAVVETVFRNAPCGILVVDVDTETCTSANESMMRFGLIADDAAGAKLTSVASMDVVACVRDVLEECRITQEPHNVEQILVVDGKETWWLVSASPLHDEHHQLTHIICTFFYIDFLKKTEEALRRSEQTFRTLIERAPDAVIVADRGGVRYVNPAAVALLGAASAHAIVGTSPLHLIDKADRAGVTRAWRSAIVGDGRKLVEARVVRNDGTHVTVEFVPIPAVFEGRSCILVVARDVTERNELYARLANADRHVALGTLAAGVAHEINSPLLFVQTNVTYVLEHLAELTGAPPEMREAMTDALEGVRRVAKTVRELRDLARGDPRAVIDVDVREVIDQVVRLSRQEVETRAKLIVDHEPVPRVCASPLVSHVFLNLLLNAAQAIVPGDPERNEVAIRTRARDTWVVVEISDTGVGISPQHIPRVFDPYFTTKPLGQGTGLGLAHAQRIVHVSGGRIVARSSGAGATFEVWLASLQN